MMGVPFLRLRMGSYRTAKWVEDLAKQELSILSGERVSLDILQTRDEVLRVETARFVRELFNQFDWLARLFNQHVGPGGLIVRLLKQTEGRESFFLERNGMRLAVYASGPGAIQIQCEKLMEGAASEAARSSVMFSGLLEARYGAFHDLTWEFLGTAVTPEQATRHYLTEFLQASR